MAIIRLVSDRVRSPRYPTSQDYYLLIVSRIRPEYGTNLNLEP